ncbi:MAG: DUF2497 domain-containing protein [Rhizobiales bacterium]|nr:DUF2497 domain-containing protein [Hyphomicrobiales bacterium]
MTQPAKVQEPSMEEILASIRRIIADDEAGKPPESQPVSDVVTALPAPVQGPPSPRSSGSAPAEPTAASESDIDTMLAEFESADGKDDGDEGGDVLELTEAMEAARPRAPAFRTIDDSSADVVFAESAPSARERPEIATVPPRSVEQDAPSRLMSENATAAVSSAFGNLAHTVLMQNARTLDDLVREMLRPMLKSWLDENLPGIVERLVRSEIERVSRGQG